MKKICTVGLVAVFAFGLGSVGCKKKAPKAQSPEAAFEMEWEAIEKNQWGTYWGLFDHGFRQMLDVQVEQMKPSAFFEEHGVQQNAVKGGGAEALVSKLLEKQRKERQAKSTPRPTIDEVKKKGKRALVLYQDGDKNCRQEFVEVDGGWKIISLPRCREQRK